MNYQTDQQLLRQYAEHQSEAAFAELVRRHVDLVHSAAVRMVCDAHLAQDVTQAAFVALAQNARLLKDRLILSGWLHRTAQNIASKAVRTDVRRRAREQEAATMNQLLSAEPDANWQQIAPHLDDALGELSEPDRDILLLSYFEGKSAREMAQILGISDEAAQKRVSRAVERLREFFAKRGITVGASGLVVVISANAVQAAPVGLALTISSTVATATITIATQTTMHWLNLKSATALLAAALAAGTGTHLVQQREANRLRVENQNLTTKQEQLTTERDAALSATLQMNEDVEQFRKEKGELLRLRGEVGLLRRQLSEFRKPQDNKSVPRNGTASAQQPIRPAPTTIEETDALQISTNTVNAMKQISLAIRMYAQENSNQFPTSMNQITNDLPPKFKGTVKLDTFEFVSHAAPVNWRSKPETIVVRERFARHTSEGKWARVYCSVDSRVIEKTSDDGNFEAWEAQNTILTANGR